MQGKEKKLVLAEALKGTLENKLDITLKTLAQFKGSEIEGCKYRHPLSESEPALNRISPVVIGGDYITTESGTGLVHTAPGHGMEDYQVNFLILIILIQISTLKPGFHWMNRDTSSKINPIWTLLTNVGLPCTVSKVLLYMLTISYN